MSSAGAVIEAVFAFRVWLEVASEDERRARARDGWYMFGSSSADMSSQACCSSARVSERRCARERERGTSATRAIAVSVARPVSRVDDKRSEQSRRAVRSVCEPEHGCRELADRAGAR